MRSLFFVVFALLALMPVSMSAQDVSGDTIPSSDAYFLPSVIQNNPNLSIYYSALRATGLADTLEQYIDPTYPGVSYDSTLACFRNTGRTIYYRTAYEEENAIFPDARTFSYTAFVITDSILAVDYNIRNLEDLRSYAEQQYPSGAGKPDYDRESSLNMFMSYHILPFRLIWDQLNTSQPEIVANHHHLDELDVEDFYETMLPHSIMRISTPYKHESYDRASYISSTEIIGIFINRKGTLKDPSNLIEGVQIFRNEDYRYENNALNGIYHYITKPLVYNNATKDALNVRMRIMANTLSPDFINSGARGRLARSGNYYDRYTVGFLPGFCKNFQWTRDSQFWVRYRDASFGCYNGDEMTLMGNFDITFRLPAVPKDGLYEIRIPGYSSPFYNETQNILYYIKKEGDDFIPCDKPLDINLDLTSPEIGYVKDNNVDTYSYRIDNPEISYEEAKELAITDNDKLMRSHGYMKAPDSYGPYDGSMRNDSYFYRKIVCEIYLESGKDYYLRMRKVSGIDPVAFNYLEIVPFDVYSGENGPEDRH